MAAIPPHTHWRVVGLHLSRLLDRNVSMFHNHGLDLESLRA